VIDRRRFLESLATAAATASAGSAFAAGVASPQTRAGADVLAGKIHFKGDARYEALRQAASWNARKPNRYPNAIVLAESDADVIAAVKLAGERGWQVTARSGGHSWSGSHTRDGALQVNLARMKQIDVDVDKGWVAVSPSVYGNVLNKKLRDEHQLFTPSAHGVNVGIGGFVMCGGHGWNSRVFGLGCENLQALDVVTAEGKLVHASAAQNSDYYWAARGAGPGYFGVATRYYLKVHKKPPVMRTHGFVFEIADLETVVAWVRDTMSTFPPILEVVLLGRLLEGVPVVTLIGNCLGDTAAEVDEALAILQRCPAVARATQKWARDIVVPFDVEPATDSNPTGARYAVDNIWTDAATDALLPLMRRLFTNFPTPQSYIFVQCWGPVRKLPDMAYSVQSNLYISSNAVYYDPADDARCELWAVQAMRQLDGISAGAQMNDENIERHPARYLSPQAAARLETLRRKHDPHGRFTGFIKPAPLGA
jgi:FAD/FMN-containing dehydrogenase